MCFFDNSSLGWEHMLIKEKTIFKKIEKRVREIFREKGEHDFEHVKRVYRLSLLLTKGRNVDMDVVKASALLHDVGHSINRMRHYKVGVPISESILKEARFPEEKTLKVLLIVEEHSLLSDKFPSSPESQIIWDADKLDGIGMIQLFRGILSPEQKEEDIFNIIKFTKEVSKNFYNALISEQAKKMGKLRYSFLMKALDRLEAEARGEP